MAVVERGLFKYMAGLRGKKGVRNRIDLTLESNHRWVVRQVFC